MKEIQLKPDYLFEVSWEVCNKVGGIHTVIATKAQTIAEGFEGVHVTIGPDVWRETGDNPEFIEETTCLSDWARLATQEGLRVRVGHWNIIGKPLAVLVDFTTIMGRKDQILGQLWNDWKLDSLQGQWDYIEPVLFGYSAGMVIESIVRHQLSMGHRIVAQFHEWMTGAGLLYLKKALPQVGTVFTTHATVLGRSLAGNGAPLYSLLQNINPQAKAQEFHVVPKQSLEQLSAQHADVFTTVSDLTANECTYLLQKKVDLVTPNGFDTDFVPTGSEFDLQRMEGRMKLFSVAEAVLQTTVPLDSLLIATSGRYEYKNKGLDLFIDALADLNARKDLDRHILAFMLIPAGNKGPRPEILPENVKTNQHTPNGFAPERFLTHNLSDPQNDPILNRLRLKGLTNSPDDKVKVIFVPSYLNGNDGVLDLPYYKLLIGMDLTVFASYYEPWGYTPLESLAFAVPTITTTLAGFGLWVSKQASQRATPAIVIRRDDNNTSEATAAIADAIFDVVATSTNQISTLRTNAKALAKCALWDNLVANYWMAYDKALHLVQQRASEFSPLAPQFPAGPVDLRAPVQPPQWSRLMVQKNIPAQLKDLDTLAHNLWWCWQPDAQELFASTCPALWETCEQNPMMLLDSISYARLEELGHDNAFATKLQKVMTRFNSYMSAPRNPKSPRIGYFSMEYGLHSSLKLYSGGLGVLAGDYLKEASDRNINMVAVGLFYRYGYFTQRLSLAGQQIATYNHQNFSQTPAVPALDENGNWITVEVAFPGRVVKIRLWVVAVGRIKLYLLDTDFEDNQEADRTITHYLYGGDQENRLKQEMILGIGGVRALHAAGCQVDLFHLNEGHAAFVALERLRQLMHDENYNFDEACELIRAESIFTTHTPVPAGHDTFSEDLVRTYMSHYPDRYKITWERFISFGRVHPADSNEKFSMSNLAANFSSGMNGVSMLHGHVSQKMFAELWPGYYPAENHIGYVTNGVHYPSWANPLWRNRLEDNASNDNLPNWDCVATMPDADIWSIRTQLRANLMRTIIEGLDTPEARQAFSPKLIMDIKENLNPKALTIGFARRFATYKRAHLLFTDLKRLAEIVNNPARPVQFLFAGKAHPHDKAGQDLIHRIFTIAQMPQFRGKILFLPNYDMQLARTMVQGVDVWLNTPSRPLEASGTSGMKAVMNGGLHFSVLDGWWVEGYKQGAGWAIAQERIYQNQAVQDEYDAEIIYSTIENEIAPMFYHRDKEDIPAAWVASIRRSMQEIAPQFSSTRMQDDYFTRYYNPQAKRHQELLSNGGQLLHQLTQWKYDTLRAWGSLGVIRTEGIGHGSLAIETGHKYKGQIVLELGTLTPDDLGIELVLAGLEPGRDEVSVSSTIPYKLVKTEGSRAYYEVTLELESPGAYDVAVRLYAWHMGLQDRMDFPLMRWV